MTADALVVILGLGGRMAERKSLCNRDFLIISHKESMVAETVDITAEAIDCLRVKSMPCDGLDTCAVIFSKWVTTCRKPSGSVSQELL